MGNKKQTEGRVAKLKPKVINKGEAHDIHIGEPNLKVYKGGLYPVEPKQTVRLVAVRKSFLSSHRLLRCVVLGDESKERTEAVRKFLKSTNLRMSYADEKYVPAGNNILICNKNMNQGGLYRENFTVSEGDVLIKNKDSVQVLPLKEFKDNYNYLKTKDDE